jgi:CheY-like chemotaxis protein
LVLLDLKIPLRNGLEVLRWMREQEQFKSLVVIMLTASSAKKDIQEAYALNVNAYLMKPSTLNEMTELARSIRTCWLEPLEALFERAAPAATTQHSH